MSDVASETELRRLAERRVDAKVGFWIHAALFVVVNAGMAFANFTTASANPWFVWSAGCWGLALFVQGLVVYLPVQAMRRQAIEAELERLRASLRR